MNCRRARSELTGARPQAPEVRQHLGNCDECREFADRLKTVEQALGAHHTQVRPSHGFATHVRARLREDENLIGWAASRVLPATVCVLLVLSWLNLRGSVAQSEAIDPTEAVLTWVVDTELAGGENR